MHNTYIRLRPPTSGCSYTLTQSARRCVNLLYFCYIFTFLNNMLFKINQSINSSNKDVLLYIYILYIVVNYRSYRIYATHTHAHTLSLSLSLSLSLYICVCVLRLYRDLIEAVLFTTLHV